MLDLAVTTPSNFVSSMANVDLQLEEEDATFSDAKIVIDLVKWKIKQTEISCQDKFYYLQESEYY